jgi:light-regulated signal transduction histidine kinase (bacteriophytochrome)
VSGADDLQSDYAAALAVHLARSSEDSLHAAYALGRQALGGGAGVVDIVLVHDRALRGLTNEKGSRTEDLGRAGEFLAESLSPFEMLLTGYRESNTRLTESNALLREAKAAADAANQELEAFSYSVAHDLRAPLRSVDGFSLALLEDYGDRLDDEGRLYLSHLRRSAQQMAQLIDDLLSLSRVTRSDFQRETVDLTQLVHGVGERLRGRNPGRNVDLIVADGLTVEGDARLLAVVFENLLGNAWKFTAKRADARIEVGREHGAGKTVFFVRDNGAGFDMAYASKLFGVFQRLHAASEFEGTGIGLATVQRIVGRHDGRIWAEGEPDKGAIFRFTLGEG